MRFFAFFQTLVLLGATATAYRLQYPDQDSKTGKKGLERRDGKYFHEPSGSLGLGHYDARFFKEELGYDEHRVALRNLIRAYLTVCSENKVETWLAHGTLLGWWWNGQVMPWDYDLDVQMSAATLDWVGENLNRTEHFYNWTGTDNSQHTSRYLLDINPHHIERDRGDGLNIIDARWIDMANGAFVDITGVAERELPENPGIWSCRNSHRYHTTDLFPMRQTEFEGLPAIVPYSFERILIEEYGERSIVATEWAGHRWVPEQKAWVRMD
ncbi:hypothetical protein BN1708_003881 [Verticillium longisporum]|uniref:LicD/FKTN/FKRP nucleotidyltransferase domain-containing protein n=1 Tax=Verticillium longisporum TaxID=100787 RepID=A0A0G4LS05_VERLO|nr:hypothetical protein BN1708_003881 [Verticillium longisporum]